MFVRFCPHPGLALCAHTLLMRSIMKLSWCVTTIYAPVSTLLVYAYVRGQCHGHSANCGTSIILHVHTCTCIHLYDPFSRCIFVCPIAKTMIKVQLAYIVSFESPRLNREATMHTSRVRYSIIHETQSTKMTTVRSAIFEYTTLKS